MQAELPDRLRRWGTILLVASVCGAASATALAQQSWKPQGPIEISAPSAPGGGTDHTARVMQRILQERQLVTVPVVVANKSGGGGMVALNYLRQFTGNAHYLQTASAVLLSSHIVGRSPVTYTDVSPIALLQSEYIVLGVRADSAIKSLADLMAALKRDIAGVSFAVGTSLGGANHAAAAAIARAVGGDARKLKTVVFKSSSESAVAALGGHVDVMAASASQILKHARTGAMRMLAVSAPRRLSDELASVPTLKESGIDAVVDNFRLLIGPSGLTAPQLAYWDDVVGRLVQTEEWKKDLATNLLENTYRSSSDTRKYLDAEYAELKELLTAMGMAK